MGTVKWVGDMILPPLIVQTADDTMFVGVLVMEDAAHVSPELKPLPEIDTVLPALTKVGLRVIFGVVVVTVNMACATSRATKPVMIMKYGPGGTPAPVPTVNVNGLKTPPGVNVQSLTLVSIAATEAEIMPLHAA